MTLADLTLAGYLWFSAMWFVFQHPLTLVGFVVLGYVAGSWMSNRRKGQ